MTGSRHVVKDQAQDGEDDHAAPDFGTFGEKGTQDHYYQHREQVARVFSTH